MRVVEKDNEVRERDGLSCLSESGPDDLQYRGFLILYKYIKGFPVVYEYHELTGHALPIVRRLPMGDPSGRGDLSVG